MQPVHAYYRTDSLLAWTDATAAAWTNGDTALPIHAKVDVGGQSVITGFLSGGIRYSVFTKTNSATLSLASAHAGTANLASGIDDNGRIWYADSGSATDWPIKSSFNGGVINSHGTVTHIASKFDSSLTVHRCEAVLPVAGGKAVVVIGTHRFNNDLTTLYFYYYDGSTWRRLQNVIQAPLTETYSNWYSHAKWAPFCFAAANQATGETVVVAADSDYGSPKVFKISPSGIESEMQNLLGIDGAYSDVKLKPTALIFNQGRYIMGVTSQRKFADDTYQYVDFMCISKDGVNWSGREHAAVVNSDSTYNRGVPTIGDKFYWIWRGLIRSAPIREEDGGNAATVTTGVISHEISLPENGVGEGSLLAADAVDITAGDVVKVESGYMNGFTPEVVRIGTFVVDQWPDELTSQGKPFRSIRMMDKASFHINTWKSPFDIDRWSRTAHFDPLKKMDKLIYKNGTNDVLFDDSGMTCNALNRPTIGFAPFSEERDGIIGTRIRFGTTSTRALSGVALLFGGKDEKYGSESTLSEVPKFNAVYIPKAGNAWTGHTQDRPVVCKSNISQEIGWNFADHLTGLLESNQADGYSKVLTRIQAADSAWSVAALTDTEIFVRRSGQWIYVYSHESDYTDANVAGKAAFVLRHKYRFADTEQFAFGGRVGLAACTDVWADNTAFGSLSNDDLVVQLSDVALYNNTYGQSYGMTQSLFTGGFWQSGSDDGYFDVSTGSGNMANVTVGMFLHIVVPSYYDRVVRVKSVGANFFRTDPLHGNGADGDGVHRAATAYGYPVGTDWATLISGIAYVKAANDAAAGQNIVQDGGGDSFDRLCGGHGFVVSADSTAGFYALYESSGQQHIQKTGYTGSGASYAAFNYLANPLPDIDAGTNAGGGNRDWLYGNSKPRDWRMFFHQSKIFAGAPADKGLLDNGYLVVDDEIIRYEKKDFLKRGIYPAQTPEYETWTVVPSFACALQAVDTPGTSTLTSWWNGAQTVGDNLGALYPGTTKHIGMLARIISRSTRSIDYTKKKEQYYVTAADSGTRSLTLNKPYTGAIIGPVAGKVGGDIALISGRGQFETPFITHAADAPVKLYPLSYSDPAPTAKLSELIRVKKFGVYAGIYNSMQEDLKFACALSGAHDYSFGARYSYTGTPGTGGVNTGVSDADFVMELSANPSLGNLDVGFRLYSLRISTSGNTCTLILSLPAAGITPSGGLKKIWEVPVEVSEHTPSWGVEKFVIVVRNGTIRVELAGKMLWEFDDEWYPEYKVRAPGPISVKSGASQPCTITILDMPEEIENHVVEMGSSGADAVGFAIQDRHVFMRPTANGGMLFTRYSVRDDLGTYTNVVQREGREISPFDTPTDVDVSGAEIGGEINMTQVLKWGYRYEMMSNRFVDTATDAKLESGRLVELGAQEQELGSLMLSGLPWADSGDLISTPYTNPAGLPSASRQWITRRATHRGANGYSATDLQVKLA